MQQEVTQSYESSQKSLRASFFYDRSAGYFKDSQMALSECKSPPPQIFLIPLDKIRITLVLKYDVFLFIYLF